MKITGPNNPIRVSLNLPSSKSISNRLLLIKFISGSGLPIFNHSKAGDTQILAQALNLIDSSKNSDEIVAIDIRDAGTPMRFLAALLSITPGKWLLTGTSRMCERPIGILVNALCQLGAQIEYTKTEGFPPLFITGSQLNRKEVSIDTGVSSQFISALMLIAPVLPQGLTIRMTGRKSSAPYISMTADLLKKAGVNIALSEEFIQIEHQKYTPDNFFVEPDWSAAAFWYEIAAFSGDALIELEGLRPSGLQGDSQAADIFTRLGVKTEFTSEGVIIQKTADPAVEHFSYDFTSCPDLFLPVAVTCAGLNVDATLTGLKALRIKESDRLRALFSELKRLGYDLTKLPGDSLRIGYGKCSPRTDKPQIIETYDDHRMAMAFAPLALLHHGIQISDPDVVNKSYPDFWKHLVKAGFALEV